MPKPAPAPAAPPTKRRGLIAWCEWWESQPLAVHIGLNALALGVFAAVGAMAVGTSKQTSAGTRPVTIAHVPTTSTRTNNTDSMCSFAHLFV